MSINRDTLIAITLGFVLGLLVTVFVLNFPKALPKKEFVPQKETKEKVIISPTESPVVLTINYPKEEEFFTVDTASCSGKTKPNSIVVISSSEDETVTQADEKGAFSSKIKLTEGINEIKIVSYDKQGASQTKIITVSFEGEDF